jgi:hypothetical protein
MELCLDKPFAAYVGDDPYVFICYAHENDDVVYPELRWLRDAGINIWYDEGISAGKVWRRELAEAIQSASKLVYYKSKASLQSDHCNREIEYALDKGIEVVPVYLDEIELTPELDLALNRVQALHRQKDSNYRQHLLKALGQSTPTVELTQVEHRTRRSWLWLATPALALLLLVVWWYRPSVAPEELTDEDVAVHTVNGLALKSIAVLPFDDLSADGSLGWLANGMAEALIGSLGRIEELRIPGRTSTTSLKHQGPRLSRLASN